MKMMFFDGRIDQSNGLVIMTTMEHRIISMMMMITTVRLDWNDAEPCNADISTLSMSDGAHYDNYRTWNFNDARTYSAGVNFVDFEAAKSDTNGKFDSAEARRWRNRHLPSQQLWMETLTDGIQISLTLIMIMMILQTVQILTITTVSWTWSNPDDDNDGIPDVCLEYRHE